MPFQRLLRLVAAGAVLAGALGLSLADWSGGSSNYRVRAGDSLWSIAEAHGLTVAQLAAANGLNILLIGTTLTLPGGRGGARAAVASSPDAPVSGFCSADRVDGGSWGVLPAGLAGTSAYYDLRPLFGEWASAYGVSEPLLEALAWQESGWQQDVVSPTGAVGVGQIEPGTAAFISSQLVGVNLDVNSASDNIRMEAAFVGYLAHVEGGNRCATIAAYYEGSLNLQRYGVLPSAQIYVADVEALEARFE
jgi:hypothetical protein